MIREYHTNELAVVIHTNKLNWSTTDEAARLIRAEGERKKIKISANELEKRVT